MITTGNAIDFLYFRKPNHPIIYNDSSRILLLPFLSLSLCRVLLSFYYVSSLNLDHYRNKVGVKELPFNQIYRSNNNNNILPLNK